MTDPDETLQISREMAAHADGLLSLIAHRYSSGLPEDLREELIALSTDFRALYEPRLRVNP